MRSNSFAVHGAFTSAPFVSSDHHAVALGRRRAEAALQHDLGIAVLVDVEGVGVDHPGKPDAMTWRRPRRVLEPDQIDLRAGRDREQIDLAVLVDVGRGDVIPAAQAGGDGVLDEIPRRCGLRLPALADATRPQLAAITRRMRLSHATDCDSFMSANHLLTAILNRDQGQSGHAGGGRAKSSARRR